MRSKLAKSVPSGARVFLIAAAVYAQQPSPANYIHVSAPFAQKIVVEEMQQHGNQIQKIGLHAVPPAATDNVIIACNIAAKIGKTETIRTELKSEVHVNIGIFIKVMPGARFFMIVTRKLIPPRSVPRPEICKLQIQ